MLNQCRWNKSRKPIEYHVARKAPRFWHERELTAENREYLKESVLDKYIKADGTPTWTPLKDEPWMRHEWTKT